MHPPNFKRELRLKVVNNSQIGGKKSILNERNTGVNATESMQTCRELKPVSEFVKLNKIFPAV
jgi:hypothetical protein